MFLDCCVASFLLQGHGFPARGQGVAWAENERCLSRRSSTSRSTSTPWSAPRQTRWWRMSTTPGALRRPAGRMVTCRPGRWARSTGIRWRPWLTCITCSNNSSGITGRPVTRLDQVRDWLVRSRLKRQIEDWFEKVLYWSGCGFKGLDQVNDWIVTSELKSQVRLGLTIGQAAWTGLGQHELGQSPGRV